MAAFIIERGYRIKCSIKRVPVTTSRPHGLGYSFTLHGPGGSRLVGFDNAHKTFERTKRSRRDLTADHWHRTARDPGRPYVFTDVPTLIDDFFDEVERVLRARGISSAVLRVEAKERAK